MCIRDRGSAVLASSAYNLDYLKRMQELLDIPCLLYTSRCVYETVFDQFDLKFLNDPKKVYGDLEEINAVAWKGFSEKDPFAAEFFANIKLTTNAFHCLFY